MPVQTPFHARTAPLCTSYRWKEWAGFLAVCSYETEVEPEYFAFRHAAGLLDVSPLQKYEIAGPDSAAFLSWVLTRDVGKLRPGRVGYSVWCDPEGKVIDDGTVARLADDRFRLTAASPTLWWLERQRRGFDVTIRDTSDTTAALALQGPNSRAILQHACGSAPADLRYFGVTSTHLGDIEIDVSRTGYTGDLGYEIWLPADRALDVWDALCEAGVDYGLRPAGLDALDIVRLEAGYILHGVDYFSAPTCLIESRKSTPTDLDLQWCVHLDRDPFVGQQPLRDERHTGSKWALVGLELDWEALEKLYETEGLPPHLPVHAWRDAIGVFSGRLQIGQATSGTWSPTLKKNLALASIERRFAEPGATVSIEHTVEYRRRKLPATIVDRPFLDLPRKRE